MEFQNQQIDTLILPSSETIIFEKLDPAYKKIRIYINIIIFSILLLLYLSAGIFFRFLLDFPWILLFSIGWSILFGLYTFMAVKRYDYEGFAIREKDIMFKSGIFFRSTLIIPFNRVQHCEIEQGPIDRFFNLSELSLFTAGGSGSDLMIPGLTHEKSAALKNFITKRVAVSDEEE
ncbi:MAG: PH domain-containing protein [Saprospiraceae bacterium]|jgi:membrane protein YdbS with pleckstrin-like domain|nr:PH domain-containing protein [Saprospiraceae bacterium]